MNMSAEVHKKYTKINNKQYTNIQKYKNKNNNALIVHSFTALTGRSSPRMAKRCD